MKNKISFIGFDLDGTLIDSHKAVYKCLCDTLPKYVDDDDMSNIIDMVFPLTIDQFPNYINFKSKNSFKLFKEEFSKTFDEKYYKTINPIEGYLNILHYCVEKLGEDKVFILTNRREESTFQVCEYFDITKIIDPEMIFITKPNNAKNPKSDSLKNVRKKLSIVNHKGFYVGDSESDLISARENNITPLYISRQDTSSLINSNIFLKHKENYFKSLSELNFFLTSYI